MNQKYTALLNNGPQTVSELPGGGSIGIEARRDGIQKFNIQGGLAGSLSSRAAVYYVRDKHSRKAVLQVWRDHNQEVVRRASERALHQQLSILGDAWKEVGEEVFELDTGEIYQTDSPQVTSKNDDKSSDEIQVSLSVATLLADPETNLTVDEAAGVADPEDKRELCKRGCGEAVYPRHFANHIATECDAVDRDAFGTDADSTGVPAR